MGSLHGCPRRNVAVLAGEGAERAHLLQHLQQGELVALGFSYAADLVQALGEGLFDLVVVVSDAAGQGVPALVESLLPHLSPETAVVLVLEAPMLEPLGPFLASVHHDFVLAPYLGDEVLARSLKLLGRSDMPVRTTVVPSTLPSQVFGAYRLEPLSRMAYLHGEEIPLSGREFGLALCLFQNPGRVWAREALCRAAWGAAAPEGSRKLDTYVSRLRQRLRLGPATGWRLSPVYGMGYRLEVTSPLGYVASAASISPASLAGAS